MKLFCFVPRCRYHGNAVDYTVSVAGNVWLASGSTSVHANDAWFTYPRIAGDHPLVQAATATWRGADALGSFSGAHTAFP